MEMLIIVLFYFFFVAILTVASNKLIKILREFRKDEIYGEENGDSEKES